jgi:dipeptidyl aminopeptidase/acylaminoacyl peptidase
MAAIKSAKKRQMTQDDLFDVKYVCDATFSPEGNLAAYTLSETSGSGDKEKQVLSIWLIRTSGGKARRLTRGKGSSYSPQFSNDGRTIYFLSSRDKTLQVYSMPVDGGEACAETNMPQGLIKFEVTRNDSLVFSALTNPPAKPSDNDHPRTDRFWFRFDPVPGYLQDINQTIYIMKHGSKPKALTDGTGLIMDFSVSADGKQLVYLVTGLPEHAFVQSHLCVIPTSGKGNSKAVLKNRVFNQVTWHPSGQSLICHGQIKGMSDQASYFTVDVKTSRISDRTGPLDLNAGVALQTHIPARIGSKMLTDSKGKLYACITRGGEAHPNIIKLKGGSSAMPVCDGQETNHLMAKHDDKLLVISHSTNEPPALYLLDEKTAQKTKLTLHNDVWQQKFNWPTVERIKVKVKRNVEVEGWVIKPKNARAPYKTVLNIHGGPHGGYGCTFWADMHELVADGYAVAFMNPRGSTGYGLDFMQSIFGCWGYPELEDFNAFLDELVKQKIAHPDKLGVTGISGGGHLSSWLTGHTNRFKAAVPEQGVYNMVSMWGVSDAGQALIDLELDSTLHKDPMKYWKHSPMAYANRCKTPTLLLQGEQDVRCPMSQAEEYFSALKHFGCEVELIRMKKCNHGAQLAGRPALRRFRMDVLREWFNRHIK